MARSHDEHDPSQAFIEKMGLFMERDGLPRIAGSLFGLLILEEGPFSLDELTERLDASKASISTNARLLEQVGKAERIARLGDRRDYYRLAPDAFQRMFRVVLQRMRETRHLLAATGCELPESRRAARERLAQVCDFYDFMIEELDATAERWQTRSAQRRAHEEMER